MPHSNSHCGVLDGGNLQLVPLRRVCLPLGRAVRIRRFFCFFFLSRSVGLCRALYRARSRSLGRYSSQAGARAVGAPRRLHHRMVQLHRACRIFSSSAMPATDTHVPMDAPFAGQRRAPLTRAPSDALLLTPPTPPAAGDAAFAYGFANYLVVAQQIDSCPKDINQVRFGRTRFFVFLFTHRLPQLYQVASQPGYRMIDTSSTSSSTSGPYMVDAAIRTGLGLGPVPGPAPGCHTYNIGVQVGISMAVCFAWAVLNRAP